MIGDEAIAGYDGSVPSRWFRVPLNQIAYVRAILEAYDGVALLHAPDPRRGEIEWLVGDGLEREAEALARRLEDEAGLIAIDRPSDWPT